MRSCVAIRHLPFEDLGYFEQLLSSCGYHTRYLDAPIARKGQIEALAPDLLIVLGGPLSANDEKDYPFIASELKLLEQRLADNRPTLGICLGGQLMARALGARVTRANRTEIGWLPLTFTEAGRESSLRHFGEASVFHWHGDAFELPENAVSLASTPDCAHQAFSCGANLLGLQFHPEVTGLGLETWYVGHYRALADASTPNVRQLRRDAARHAAQLERNGRPFFHEWLKQLEY